MDQQTDLSDAPPVERPRALDYLIADYGNYVGFDGLAFDENNSLSLSVEDTDLMIEYTGEGSAILFQSLLGTLPAEPDQALYSKLNLLNTNSFRSGGGFLSIIPESWELLWSDRLPVDLLNVEMLDEAVKDAARHAEAWREIAATILTPDEEEATPLHAANHFSMISV